MAIAMLSVAGISRRGAGWLVIAECVAAESWLSVWPTPTACVLVDDVFQSGHRDATAAGRRDAQVTGPAGSRLHAPLPGVQKRLRGQTRWSSPTSIKDHALAKARSSSSFTPLTFGTMYRRSDARFADGTNELRSSAV